MKKTLQTVTLCLVVCATMLSASISAQATEAAHVHGLMHLDIAVDKQLLTVQLESPLDSLLGFGRRPRTPAERQAADALLKLMGDAATLFKPDAAAQCVPTTVSLESAALQSMAPPTGTQVGNESDHADLNASYEFRCAHPDKLTVVEVGLFDAFKRLHKIEVQVAGAKLQSKQTLQRPNKRVRLTR